MNIIVGKTSGFCYGVKRTVNGSLEEIKNKGNKNIYCLGELVHNKQVITDLEQKGIKLINNIDEIENNNSKVIIRAHGVEKKIYDLAKNKGIELIDYTCPNVLRIHKIAEEYEKNGYYILLTGTKNHPEIIGTMSYCGNNFDLIEKEEDINKAINKFNKTNIKKLLLISQTTYSIKKFKNIEKLVKENISEDINLVIKNTICLATEQRQAEAKELSAKVDMMIIIGGKNSSNTKKLYEVALESCKNTICIETKSELENIEFTDVQKIGIMAGASTPPESIEEVVNLLSK